MKSSANGREKGVNRHDISRSLDWLSAAELDAQQVLNSHASNKKVAMVGRWFLSEKLLHSLILAHLGHKQATDTRFLLQLSNFTLRRLLIGLNPFSHRKALIR